MKCLPAIAWFGLILYLSLKPSIELPHAFFPAADKVYHLMMYAIWQYFFFIALKGSTSTFLLSLFLLLNILVGGGMELLQAYLNEGRTAEWADFLFNVIGALVVYLFSFRRL